VDAIIFKTTKVRNRLILELSDLSDFIWSCQDNGVKSWKYGRHPFAPTWPAPACSRTCIKIWRSYWNY